MSWQGNVVSLHISAMAEAPIDSVGEVRVVAGKGLEGDRYFKKIGTFSKKDGPDREVTLIESESIAALERDYGARIDASTSRRNIVTRGVALNHLVGKEFWVGEVRLRGLRLCEPCGHLQKLTVKEVVPGLIHRGGLRAQVLSDGVIRAGDRIRPEASPS